MGMQTAVLLLTRILHHSCMRTLNIFTKYSGINCYGYFPLSPRDHFYPKYKSMVEKDNDEAMEKIIKNPEELAKFYQKHEEIDSAYTYGDIRIITWAADGDNEKHQNDKLRDVVSDII